MQSRTISFMRMYMGPFLVMTGFYLYNQDLGVNGFIIAFAVAFGFVYAIKPFITQLAISYKDEPVSFGIENRNFYFKDRSNEANINLDKSKLLGNKKYFFIIAENGQVLFLPKEILNRNMLDLLSAEICGEL